MSPFVLIALAALLGFIVGWFAHGPKEASSSAAAAATSAAAPAAAPAANPLVAEVDRLKKQLATLETFNAGLEAMVHGRDATITGIMRKQAEAS
jgi:hypothetical protein